MDQEVGNGNSSTMVGFGGVGGVWSSPSSQHHHGMMMMMFPPTTTTASSQQPSHHHHYHHHHGGGGDDAPLPPLPPSTANFIGGGGGGGGSCSQTSFLMPLEKSSNNNNNNSCVANSTGYYFMNPTTHHHHHAAGEGSTSNADNGSSIKAKIMGHPHYPRLLSAYVSCQKVGAPPEVVRRLEEAAEAVGVGRTRGGGGGGYIGEDPALDQFMEAYCEMLTKYEQELTKPLKEAMVFLSKIECQFNALSLSSPSSFNSSPPGAYGSTADRNGSPDEEIDMNANFEDSQVEDKELKCQLLRKYSGYLGSLKQEFMKKRKKGKLPKEARQQLIDWWTRHYKWPYPSESQKLALAEATGLDQKQINNWFINQRKRHWKPSEDMQFVVMDATHHPHMFMEGVHPYSMDIPPALL